MGKCNNDEFWDKLFIISYDIIQPLIKNLVLLGKHLAICLVRFYIVYAYFFIGFDVMMLHLPLSIFWQGQCRICTQALQSLYK